MTIAVDMGRKATKTNKQTNKQTTLMDEISRLIPILIFIIYIES